jgi:hypothetical protein
MKETEQRWLLSLVKENMLKQNKEIEPNEIPKSRKPTSRYQGLLVDFYKELKTVESPDGFDKWFENNDLRNYNQTPKLIEFFEEITKKLQLTVEKVNYSDYGNYDAYKEAQVQKLLFAIAERYLEEPEPTLNVIKNAINEKYPNLVEDEPEAELERYESEYKQFIEKELEGLKEQLEENKEVLKEEIKKIETAKTDIEKIAEDLNEVIYLGNDIWELIIYSALSSYCPKILINSIPTRANLHMMLVGDISTAKSKIMHILKQISPKAEWFTKTTEASFEGIATRGSIEQGIVDFANNGSLLIFDLNEKQISTLREILDNDKIKIVKAGEEKTVDLNITVQVAENPQTDFFRNEINLREQIVYSDGLLSRFDVLIPLTTSKEKNELLLEKVNIFGSTTKHIDLEKISQILKTKAVGMKEIRGIILTEQQKQKVKEVFLKHNIDLKQRPLLVLRDMETIARLINVIVVSNFYERKQEKRVENDKEAVYLVAEDKDIEKAIELWETLIDLRKTLYTEENRITIITIEDKILMELAKLGGKISCPDFEKIIDREGICSKATFYRKLERLNGKKITIDGNYKREIVLL